MERRIVYICRWAFSDLTPNLTHLVTAPPVRLLLVPDIYVL
jgi:hypothetical protein